MTDTMAYQKQRALQRNLNLSGIPLHKLVGNYGAVCTMLEKEDGKVKGSPEEDAIWFYMANHAVAEIGMALEDYEPLGEYQHHVENYHEMIQMKSLRMFFYMLMITAREARHCKTYSITDSMKNKYPKAWATHEKFSGFSPEKFEKWAKQSGVTVGEWLDYVQKQYTTSGCYGGSYGGKPWANITKVTKEFCKGTITMEMLLDTAFTLSHNCGPIFNKGMLFNSSGHELIKILDVQRSGQIPQMVANSESKHVTASMKIYQKEIEKLVPTFGGYVDWFQVEKLGAVGSYSTQKSVQESEHGKPDVADVNDKMAAMKAKIAKKKQDEEAALFASTHFEIMPDVFVDKIERKAS